MRDLEKLLERVANERRDPVLAARDAKEYFSSGQERVFRLSFERKGSLSGVSDGLFVQSLVIDDKERVPIGELSLQSSSLSQARGGAYVSWYRGGIYGVTSQELLRAKQCVLSGCLGLAGMTPFWVLDWDYFRKFYTVRDGPIPKLESPVQGSIIGFNPVTKHLSEFS